MRDDWGKGNTESGWGCPGLGSHLGIENVHGDKVDKRTFFPLVMIITLHNSSSVNEWPYMLLHDIRAATAIALPLFDISIAFVTRWIGDYDTIGSIILKVKKKREEGRGGIGHPIVFEQRVHGWYQVISNADGSNCCTFWKGAVVAFFSTPLSLFLTLFLSIVFPESFEWRIYISIPYSLFSSLSLSHTHS